MEPIGSLAASRLESPRVVLDPLAPEHADELGTVLDDVSLHRFIGGQPPGVEELRARFRRQARGRSPDGSERWLNWTVRECSSGRAVGTVQATIQSGELGPLAVLAWVIGSAYQGQGIAKEAARLMVSWLREQGVGSLRAHIHPDNHASIAVARSLGLGPTDVFLDGELRWESSPGE